MLQDRVVLTIVVNGQPTEVSLNANEPLLAAIPKALEQTRNTGQPPGNWELRDPAGAVLNSDDKVGAFRFPPGTTLFLNLKAGVGGSL